VFFAQLLAFPNIYYDAQCVNPPGLAASEYNRTDYASMSYTECTIGDIHYAVTWSLDVRKEIHERACCMRLLLLNLRYFIECRSLRVRFCCRR